MRYIVLSFLAVSLSLTAAPQSSAYVFGGIRLKAERSADTTRINNLARNGFEYLSEKGYPGKARDKAKACIDTAQSICRSKSIEPTALLCLLNANYYFMTGEYLKASYEATKALERSKIEKNTFLHAKSLIFFGNYYQKTGFMTESLAHFEMAISLAEANNLKTIKPAAYLGKGAVYESIDLIKYRESLENLVLEAEKEKNIAYLKRGCYLLGTHLGEKAENRPRAYSLFRRSIALSVADNDTISAALSLANMGWTYYINEMYDSSLYCYEKSLEYSIPVRQYGTAANAFGNIGTINRDLGNIQRSLTNYNLAIEYAGKVKDWFSLQWVYKDMSDMYIKLKDTEKAFNAFTLHKQFNDSLLISRNKAGLQDAILRYQTDTQRKEVQLLSLKLKNQRLLIFGFSGLILLGLAITILLFRGSRLKATRRISEMKMRISEMTQANLRQQINPHFIFNTLNSIQYYMYQNDKLATNIYMTKFSQLMRKVLENSQHTSVSLQDELDALNLYLELECIRFKDKFEYKINIDEEIDPLLFKVPTMLIQPYVENSICHGMMPAEGKGMLNVHLKLDADHINCTIEDNGIGREAAMKRKNGDNEHHSSLGTKITASRLSLANEIYGTSLKINYTDLKNDNGEPGGTRVEIHIPIIA